MKRILIVEDDKTISLTLALHLKSRDYNIIAPRNEESGTQLAVQTKPSLMIVDAAHGGSDSLSWAKKLGDMANLSEVPVIVLAGDEKVREWARRIGADEILDNPIEAERLVRVVESRLGARRAS